jgi:hypothetical protein
MATKIYTTYDTTYDQSDPHYYNQHCRYRIKYFSSVEYLRLQPSGHTFIGWHRKQLIKIILLLL